MKVSDFVSLYIFHHSHPVFICMNSPHTFHHHFRLCNLFLSNFPSYFIYCRKINQFSGCCMISTDKSLFKMLGSAWEEMEWITSFLADEQYLFSRYLLCISSLKLLFFPSGFVSAVNDYVFLLQLLFSIIASLLLFIWYLMFFCPWWFFQCKSFSSAPIFRISEKLIQVVGEVIAVF